MPYAVIQFTIVAQVFSHWQQKALQRATFEELSFEGMSLLVFDKSGLLDQIFSCSSRISLDVTGPQKDGETGSFQRVEHESEQDILERQEREWAAW